MSVIEDSRKIMQDFIAPELRGIAASLDALQKRYEILDRKIDEVDRRAEKRSAETEQRAEKTARRSAVPTPIKQFVDLASRNRKSGSTRLTNGSIRWTNGLTQCSRRQIASTKRLCQLFACPP